MSQPEQENKKIPEPGEMWLIREPYRFAGVQLHILSQDEESGTYRADAYLSWPDFNGTNVPLSQADILNTMKARYLGKSEPNPWHAWLGWTGITNPFRVAKISKTQTQCP